VFRIVNFGSDVENMNLRLNTWKAGDKRFADGLSDHAIAIAKALDVSLDWLLLGEEIKNSSPRTVQAFKELTSLPMKSQKAICDLIFSVKELKK
jgi:hypothetical protein